MEDEMQDEVEFNDLCLTCGKEVPVKLWSFSCEKNHSTVHQEPCSRCNRLCGITIGDDFVGVNVLICPDCMDKIRNKIK